MAEKSKLAGSVGVTVFFGVYWDQYQQYPTGISLFQTISRYNPILTGLTLQFAASCDDEQTYALDKTSKASIVTILTFQITS